MRQLTSFDHLAISEELGSLVGLRFTKFSTLPNGYKLKLGSKDILFLPPDRLYRTNYSLPASAPDPFSQKVRKELKGLKLEAVRTLNLDRLMFFDFGQRKLIFELFREGNAVLLDENEKILAVLHPGSWRHRELKVGVMYKTPPAPAISENRLLLESTLLRDLIRSGIPKPYALELLHRLDIASETSSSSVDQGTLLEALQKLLEELRSPGGFICEGEPYPISLSYLSCEKRFDTFNEAIDSFTPTFFTLQREESRKPTKLDYMVKSLQELEEEIKVLEAALNEIYENWSALEEMFRSRNFRSVGKLRFKGVKGKEVTFDFTP